MQRVFVHAHHAIFDPHSLEIEVKLDVILSHLWYVLLPEGEMGKSRNLLCRKAFMAQGVDSEYLGTNMYDSERRAFYPWWRSHGDKTQLH